MTDISNASRTNLMDLESKQWSQELLDLFEVKHDMLADIKSNAEIYGHISEGPLKGIPIAGTILCFGYSWTGITLHAFAHSLISIWGGH